METPSATPLADVVLHPVRGHLAFEMCVEQLGSAIRLGVFRAGDRLPPERELAARMDVSRATLREAMSALRAAGFVNTSRGRGGGTIVADVIGSATAFDAETDAATLAAETADVIAFRAVVEPGAADTAARRELSAAERELLATSLAEMDAAGDPAAYRQADARLHLAIATVSGSVSLAQACGDAQIRVHRLLERIPFLERNIEHSDDQHRRVVRAILAGDADTARIVMREHCDATAALLNGLVT